MAFVVVPDFTVIFVRSFAPWASLKVRTIVEPSEADVLGAWSPVVTSNRLHAVDLVVGGGGVTGPRV